MKFFFVILLLINHALGGDPPPIAIAGGKFTPLFGFGKQSTQREYQIEPFAIDKFPVSRELYRRFVLAQPHWSKGHVDPLYSDENYLRDFSTKGKRATYPVTYVSWFAAQAYCEWKGGRLPTVLEWEFVASASATKANAARDPEFVENILLWYSKPSGNQGLSPIGKSAANFYGVHDLHGLIWEWTLDFNSVFVSGDNRQDGDKSTAAVCGAGPVNASNRSDYAAFMRYATRSSVEARYAQPNLGFRCAYEGLTKR
jgi:formylglycine-generating enzyme required for sulfatase activity